MHGLTGIVSAGCTVAGRSTPREIAISAIVCGGIPDPAGVGTYTRRELDPREILERKYWRGTSRRAWQGGSTEGKE